MATNIKLLEQLVERAVRRLQDLTAERDQLREKLHSLERRAEAREKAELDGAPDDMTRIVAVLSESLADLRSEPASSAETGGS